MTRTLFIQQSSIPAYRVPFFNALESCRAPDTKIILLTSSKAESASDSHDAWDFECRDSRITWLAGRRASWQRIGDWDVDFDDTTTLVLASNIRMLSNIPLIRRAKSVGAKLISWSHVSSHTSHPTLARLRKRFNKWAYDHHMIYTEFELPELLAEGIPSELITPLNNALSADNLLNYLNRFDVFHAQGNVAERIHYMRQHLPEQITDVLALRGLRANQYFLFCSRLVAKTDLELLFDAFAKSRAHRLDGYQLVIIGDGPRREAFSRQCEQLGVADRVHFLGKKLDAADLAPWFLGAKFFVYPGAIGLSVCHAFQHGLPVLTHDDAQRHGPEFRYLESNLNGLTFNFKSVESLQRNLDFAASTDTASMSLRAAETVHVRFTFEGMVENFVKATGFE